MFLDLKIPVGLYSNYATYIFDRNDPATKIVSFDNISTSSSIYEINSNIITSSFKSFTFRDPWRLFYNEVGAINFNAILNLRSDTSSQLLSSAICYDATHDQKTKETKLKFQDLKDQFNSIVLNNDSRDPNAIINLVSKNILGYELINITTDPLVITSIPPIYNNENVKFADYLNSILQYCSFKNSDGGVFRRKILTWVASSTPPYGQYKIKNYLDAIVQSAVFDVDRIVDGGIKEESGRSQVYNTFTYAYNAGNTTDGYRLSPQTTLPLTNRMLTSININRVRNLNLTFARINSATVALNACNYYANLLTSRRGRISFTQDLSTAQESQYIPVIGNLFIIRLVNEFFNVEGSYWLEEIQIDPLINNITYGFVEKLVTDIGIII